MSSKEYFARLSEDEKKIFVKPANRVRSLRAAQRRELRQEAELAKTREVIKQLQDELGIYDDPPPAKSTSPKK